MEIILPPTCASLTGTLNKKHGYAIRERKGHFYGLRNPRGSVPPDGHWRFIADCAELAASGLIIADIRVPHDELFDALIEAHRIVAAQHLRLTSYRARDIRNLKTTFGL